MTLDDLAEQLGYHFYGNRWHFSSKGYARLKIWNLEQSPDTPEYPSSDLKPMAVIVTSVACNEVSLKITQREQDAPETQKPFCRFNHSYSLSLQAENMDAAKLARYQRAVLAYTGEPTSWRPGAQGGEFRGYQATQHLARNRQQFIGGGSSGAQPHRAGSETSVRDLEKVTTWMDQPGRQRRSTPCGQNTRPGRSSAC